MKEQTRLNQVEGSCDLFIIQSATNSSVVWQCGGWREEGGEEGGEDGEVGGMGGVMEGRMEWMEGKLMVDGRRSAGCRENTTGQILTCTVLCPTKLFYRHAYTLKCTHKHTPRTQLEHSKPAVV